MPPTRAPKVMPQGLRPSCSPHPISRAPPMRRMGSRRVPCGRPSFSQHCSFSSLQPVASPTPATSRHASVSLSSCAAHAPPNPQRHPMPAFIAPPLPAARLTSLAPSSAPFLAHGARQTKFKPPITAQTISHPQPRAFSSSHPKLPISQSPHPPCHSPCPNLHFVNFVVSPPRPPPPHPLTCPTSRPSCTCPPSLPPVTSFCPHFPTIQQTWRASPTCRSRVSAVGWAPNVPVQRRRGSAVRFNRFVRRRRDLGVGVQHGWLSPTQRTERIRIQERARQPPRTVALPGPAGPAR